MAKFLEVGATARAHSVWYGAQLMVVLKHIFIDKGRNKGAQLKESHIFLTKISRVAH
jgi:hypothetical protein